VKPLILHSEAQKELDEAMAFYENRRPGLGKNFLEEVEKSWKSISQFPQAGSLFSETIFRKAVVQRFPYLIYYEELEEHIFVLAVAHAKRKPGYWLNRADQ
jgi:toxin ParE1/3/4